MKKYAKYLIALAVIVLAVVAIRATGISDYLTLENLKANKDVLNTMVADHYITSTLIFIGLYILVAGLSIPGATVLTLAGGFLFGTIVGALFVNVGATIGASLAFFAARYLFGDTLHKKYEKQLDKFNMECHMHGHNYLLTLRFIPVFPFFLVNIIAGLTKIKFRTFLWTTMVGILPGSLVYTFAGRQLYTVTSLKDVVSLNMLLAFVFLGLFALIPVVYKHYHKHKASKKQYTVCE